MGGLSADFQVGRGAKLLIGFIVFVSLSLLIGYDSWVLGTARINPIPELTQGETDQALVLNEGLQPSFRWVFSASPSTSTEFSISLQDHDISLFFENKSAFSGPDAPRFRQTTGKSASESLGFVYWEELRKGMSTGGSVGSASADAVSPDAARIVEKTLRFKKGDTFFQKAAKLGLPRNTVAEIIGSVRKAVDLRSIAVGDSLTLRSREGASDWLDLVYEKEDDYRLVITYAADGYSVAKEPVILMPKLRMAEGTIENSLYMGARKTGLSPGLIHKLVQIFSWDVDFLVDLRRGDSFKVIYESWYRDGEFVRDGVILATRFVNNGRVLDAFWFEEEEGREDYFNSEGRNLRKAFLKSPLQYRRISSNFSYRRFHPILKEYRPHLGIDYAAPSGTPVQTIGDGKVLFCGWKNGFGRFVQIRHHNGIESSYGHLRGIAKNVKTGRRVKQGQLIGWVGQTGLATGPHLDFRMTMGGKHVNPLKVLAQSTVMKSLSPDHRQAFEERVAKFGPILDGEKHLAAAN